MFREIRFDAHDVRRDRYEELIEWVRSLGIDPSNVRAQGVIIPGEQGYNLHLSEFVRDEQGKLILDQAFNEVVSKPLVIDLGPEKTWPGWLSVTSMEDV